MKTSGLLDKIGCAIFALVGCGAMAVVAVSVFREAWGHSRNAAAVRQLAPETARDLAAASGDRRVLVVGRIDPASHVIEPKRGLALFVRETCSLESRRSRRGRRTTSYEWGGRQAAIPPLRLVLEDGSVTVIRATPACKLRQPSLHEPGVDGDGNVRYDGFKPGDLVLVDGTATNGMVRADVLHGGGSVDAYVADLEEDGRSARKFGLWMLAGIVLITSLAIWYIVRPRSAPAPDRSTAARGAQPAR